MPVFHVDSQTVQKIQQFLVQKGQACCVRVEIRSSGCCDAALGLAAQEPAQTDIVEQHDSLQIAMPLEIYQLVGGITISGSDDEPLQNFFLTSEKPLNEWSGFAPCSIQIY